MLLKPSIKNVSAAIADGIGDGVASLEVDACNASFATRASRFINCEQTMSSINGLGANSPIQKIINQPIQKQTPVDGAQHSPSLDKLELSGMSHLLKTLKSNDVRTDKVSQIRAQIEAGTYETDDKLDIAADKLLDDLLK